MNNLFIIIATVFLTVLGCENNTVDPNRTGTVEGQVVIGPLCGNVTAESDNSNPCGFSDDLLDDIYSKYKVEISSASSGKLVSKPVILDRTGLFSFEVPVGSYNVEVIRPEGSTTPTSPMNNINDVKKTVSVTEGETVKLILQVNTGIK